MAHSLAPTGEALDEGLDILSGTKIPDGQSWAAFTTVWGLKFHTYTSLMVAKSGSTKYYFICLLILVLFAWNIPQLPLPVCQSHSISPLDLHVEELPDLSFRGLCFLQGADHITTVCM